MPAVELDDFLASYQILHHPSQGSALVRGLVEGLGNLA